MKNILLLSLLFAFSSFAQNTLTFDKKNVQCEDKWVAFPMAKDSTYAFGFVYIDATAGLTFNFEGKFKVDATGKLVKEKSNSDGTTSSVKVRLQPNKTLLAEIPKSKFTDLELEATPKWLANYKTDENSIKRLYDWGYRYNGWGECRKALTFLEKAEKIDPNYDGLQTELAYAYNALEEYENAINALVKTLDKRPSDCYALKELAYAYRHLKDLKKAEDVYNKMVSACDNKNFIQETAYNMASHYYSEKDKKNFKKWNKEARKWVSENQYTRNLDLMEKQL